MTRNCCRVSLLEGVASNEVRARGRLSPQKKFKNCPDLLTIGVSEVIFSAQVCSFGVFCLYAKGVDDERH